MKFDKLTNKISPSLIRYIIVGVVSLGADYTTFVCMYYVIGTGTAWAATSGLVVGFIVNFTLNKIWSFGNRQSEVKHVLRQAIAYISLVILNSIFTYYFIEFLRIHDILEPKYSKLLASVLTTLWNYVIYKKLIFKSK